MKREHHIEIWWDSKITGACNQCHMNGPHIIEFTKDKDFEIFSQWTCSKLGADIVRKVVGIISQFIKGYESNDSVLILHYFNKYHFDQESQIPLVIFCSGCYSETINKKKKDTLQPFAHFTTHHFRYFDNSLTKDLISHIKKNVEPTNRAKLKDVDRKVQCWTDATYIQRDIVEIMKENPFFQSIDIHSRTGNAVEQIKARS